MKKFNWLAVAMGVAFSVQMPPSVAADYSKSVVPLLDAFKGSCSSRGKWSDTAYAQSRALTQVLESLKTDTDCESFNSAMTRIHEISSLAHGVIGSPTILEYRQTQEELQELTLALEGATDATLIEFLTQSLFDAQIRLISLRAQETAFKDSTYNDVFYDDVYAKASRELATYFQELFTYSNDLYSCLRRSPANAVRLITSLGSIAGSFVSPIYGAAGYIGGELLSLAVSALENAKIDKGIWDLYKVHMPSALTCSFDALTNAYCQAQDTADLLHFQEENYGGPNKEADPIWTGMDILTRKLGVLNRWLLEVKTGILPEDDEGAEGVIEVISKFNAIELMNVSVLGKLGKYKKLIDRAMDAQTKQDFLIQAIVEASNMLNNSEKIQNSPFEGEDSRHYACWLFKGVIEIANCPAKGEFQSTDNYVKDNLADLIAEATIIKVMQMNWPAIRDRIKARVEVEFNDRVFVDPSALFAQAREQNSDNLSPENVMLKIKSFLMGFRDRSLTRGASHRVPLIDDTVKRIDGATAMIQLASENMNQEGVSLGELFGSFNLRYGTQFISKRIASFIEWDFQDRLKAGDLPEDFEDILRQAGGEIRLRLLNAGLEDSDSLGADLENARGEMEEIISIHRRVFKRPLIQSIEKLAKRAQGERLEDGPRRVNSQRLARLCVLTISTGWKWPSDKTKEICEKQVLFSWLNDPEGKLKITVKHLKGELDSLRGFPGRAKKARYCAYYNYRRANRIAQIVGSRQKDDKKQVFFSQESDAPMDPQLWKKLVVPSLDSL